MISYSAIIHESYKLTVRNKALWLFGLFVVGGFNLNFFQFQHIPAREYHDRFGTWATVNYLIHHPQLLMLASVLVLAFSLLGLVATNWSRIMLVLSARAVLEKLPLEMDREMKNSRRFLFPMIRLSLMTTAVMVLAAGTLALPLLFLGFEPATAPVLWSAGTVIFLPIAFTVSCLNIFSGFFMVVFKQPLSSSVRLATDFFAANWHAVLGFSLVLAVIYSAAFFGGIALVYAVKILAGAAISLFLLLGNLEFSGIVRVVPLLSNLVLWGLLAGLNVFFNTALLMFFLQLVAPVKFEGSVGAVSPAVAGAK